jgi:hypothetical protein
LSKKNRFEIPRTVARCAAIPGVAAVATTLSARAPDSRWLTAPLLLVALGLTGGAAAQNTLGKPARTATDYAPIALHVACGELFNAPCGKVLPRIAARIAPMGIDLRPVQSGGALDTVAAVCQGQAAAAIAPTDVLAQLAYQPACLGRYDVIGRPLYPLYAFLVARAGATFRSLEDLASDGRDATIAAGADGSGGQITLGALLKSNPPRQRAITITNDDAPATLERIADGSIDGFFAVESLDSPLINQVRMSTDARGEPLYKFIDVRPGTNLPRADDGRCVYRLTALDFGGTAPVTTVSVDAVMILGRAFRGVHARGGPLAPDALASAIDATRAAILADMKSSADWRPAGSSCQ